MGVRSPLHRRTAGVGPAVVFLHPSGMDGRIWAPVVEALPDVTAIVVDRPGHGGSVDRVALQRAAESVRSADEYAAHVVTLRSVDEEPERVEETLADAADGPVTVVGHGDGGLLALDLAARGRLRVGAVVTVDAPVLPPPTDVDIDAVLAMIEERGADLDAQRAELDRAFRTRDVEAYTASVLAQYDLSSLGAEAETVRLMVRDNAFPALLTAPSRLPGSVDLGAVGVPVHTVHAASAPPAPGDLERAMPRAVVATVTIPEAPSTLPLAAPAALARVIRTAVHGGR